MIKNQYRKCNPIHHSLYHNENIAHTHNHNNNHIRKSFKSRRRSSTISINQYPYTHYNNYNHSSTTSDTYPLSTGPTVTTNDSNISSTHHNPNPPHSPNIYSHNYRHSADNTLMPIYCPQSRPPTTINKSPTPFTMSFITISQHCLRF